MQPKNFPGAVPYLIGRSRSHPSSSIQLNISQSEHHPPIYHSTTLELRTACPCNAQTTGATTDQMGKGLASRVAITGLQYCTNAPKRNIRMLIPGNTKPIKFAYLVNMGPLLGLPVAGVTPSPRSSLEGSGLGMACGSMDHSPRHRRLIVISNSRLCSKLKHYYLGSHCSTSWFPASYASHISRPHLALVTTHGIPNPTRFCSMIPLQDLKSGFIWIFSVFALSHLI